MRTALFAALAPLAALTLALPLVVARAEGAHTARAVLKDAKGEKVGTATLVEVKGGVQVVVKAQGLPPGTHGVHIHAVGRCDDPEFKSAGPHFNPTARKHGMKNPEGHHAGDLPNLVVGADGKGELKGALEGATLGQGSASLLGPQFTALVVHASPDDEASDPAGNSGARIACGVIAHGR